MGLYRRAVEIGVDPDTIQGRFNVQKGTGYIHQHGVVDQRRLALSLTDNSQLFAQDPARIRQSNQR